MKLALLRCCTTPIFLNQYETSTNAVLERLGVTVVGDTEFNCCGYPLRNYHRSAWVLASARNLALAEKRSLDILTVCNCCYGSLKLAEKLLETDDTLRERTNSHLARDGLVYSGRFSAKHLLHVLHDEIGIDRLKREVRRRFRGLKMATHYGCHLLRPSEIARFDDPISPVKFDRLVEVTGAESIPWSRKLDCCGSPLWGVNDELSMSLTAKKLTSAKESGADYLCVACSYCQLQFDRVQGRYLPRAVGNPLPSILFTQLLGLCMGVDDKALGLELNQIPPMDLAGYL